MRPIGGHAVFLDARRVPPHLPQDAVPRPDAGGGSCTSIPASARWSAASSRAGRDPLTGDHRRPTLELVRLTIPRRVYTQAHMDVVAESVIRGFLRTRADPRPEWSTSRPRCASSPRDSTRSRRPSTTRPPERMSSRRSRRCDTAGPSAAHGRGSGQNGGGWSQPPSRRSSASRSRRSCRAVLVCRVGGVCSGASGSCRASSSRNLERGDVLRPRQQAPGQPAPVAGGQRRLSARVFRCRRGLRGAGPVPAGLEVVVGPVQRPGVGGACPAFRVGHVVVEVAAVRGDLAAGAAAVPVEGPDLFDHCGGGSVPVGAEVQRLAGEGVDAEPAPDRAGGGDDGAGVLGGDPAVAGDLAGAVATPVATSKGTTIHTVAGGAAGEHGHGPGCPSRAGIGSSVTGRHGRRSAPASAGPAVAAPSTSASPSAVEGSVSVVSGRARVVGVVGVVGAGAVVCPSSPSVARSERSWSRVRGSPAARNARASDSIRSRMATVRSALVLIVITPVPSSSMLPYALRRASASARRAPASAGRARRGSGASGHDQPGGWPGPVRHGRQDPRHDLLDQSAPTAASARRAPGRGVGAGPAIRVACRSDTVPASSRSSGPGGGAGWWPAGAGGRPPRPGPRSRWRPRG